ncbi:hypothetical protein [uncultured Roseibium sp.]|uniref:hypothetical protein n=1 Tax=uncultured Roseibium sp. TaxID=1936171 RepID=UPI003216941F
MFFEMIRPRIFVQMPAVAAVALVAGFSGLLSGPAQAQQIILRCTPPLVANSDGTDCVRPAAQQKKPGGLTAFAIRKPNGQQVGLYRKTGNNTWVGPIPNGGGVVQWSARSDSRSLLLYRKVPTKITIGVYDDGSVVAPGLPVGSVLGDRAY